MRTWCLLALIALLAGGCARQDEPPRSAEAAVPQTAAHDSPQPEPVNEEQAQPPLPADCPLLERIAVVGASASDGFLAQLVLEEAGSARVIDLSFTHVLAAIVLDEDAVLLPHTDFQFYSDPQRYGPQLLSAALEDEPTLIVGIDLMFWFAYGYAPSRTPEQEVTWRSKRLAEGLELLEDLPCPIVLGDFPDMSSAAPWMLPRHMIPSDAALAALNDQLYDWAKDRNDVTIFPLRDLHRRMKSGEALRIGANDWDAEEAQALLLADGLHPSDEGLIALGLQVAELLAAGDRGCLAEHFVQRTEDVRARLRESFAQPTGTQPEPSPAPVGG